MLHCALFKYLFYFKGNLVLPISIFLTIWSSQVSYSRLIIEFLIGLFFSVYILAMSILSPCPPLLDHWLGEFMIVSAWVILEFVFMRVRCLVASKLEKISSENTLLVLGVVTQLGQVFGGIIAYVCVDLYRLLRARPDCIFDHSYCKIQ